MLWFRVGVLAWTCVVSVDAWLLLAAQPQWNTVMQRCLVELRISVEDRTTKKYAHRHDRDMEQFNDVSSEAEFSLRDRCETHTLTASGFYAGAPATHAKSLFL